MYINNEPRYPWIEGFDDVIIKELFGPHRYKYPTDRERVVEGKQKTLIPLSSADFGIFYCDDDPSDQPDWPCHLSIDAVEWNNEYYLLTDTLAYCKGVHAALQTLLDY